VRIPVIAAGGIADGRGMAAAFMLGAEGVQCGTRFLSAYECGIHENYKKKVIDARDIATQVTGRRLGHPVRALKNPFSNKFAELERDPAVTDEQLAAEGIAALEGWMQDIGVVMHSAELGVTNDNIEAIADSTIIFDAGYHKLTRDEVIGILRQSL
jgi:NAD(P)H-dependent flavin oxidoreductase YrpB (nitropropane dioxygenase family)